MSPARIALLVGLALLLCTPTVIVLADQDLFADVTEGAEVAEVSEEKSSKSSSLSSTSSSVSSETSASSVTSSISSSSTPSIQLRVNERRDERKADATPLATTGSKSILIFLGVQRAYLLEDGVVQKTYQISSGAPLTPTPKGKFQIYRKQELRISGLDAPYRMPKYMAFTKSESHGMHALPYLGNSPEDSFYWQEAVEHIGKPVSHGCIRFLPEEADEIYEWAEVGTPIEIKA